MTDFKEFDYAPLKERLGAELLTKRLERQRKLRFQVHRKVNTPRLLKTGLAFTGMLKRGKRNAAKLKTTHNDFQLKHLPQSLSGFRLLHLSDLHFECNPELTDVLINAIQQLEFDSVVMTGDYCFHHDDPVDRVTRELRRVRSAIEQPVYAILGNHDPIHLALYFEKMNIHLLLNESVTITRHDAQLYIAGIDDPYYFKTDDINTAAKDIPAQAISILLSHSPERYAEAAKNHFDIMLSGHTHGGQVCLPGGVALFKNAPTPRRMLHGSWKYHQLQGYTSRGSGATGLDVRYNCPPEITLHTLKKS